MGNFVEAVIDAALDNDLDTATFLGGILLWIVVIPFMILLPFMRVPPDDNTRRYS